MAKQSIGLLASLLSPGAARQATREQTLQNILSTAGSPNPLLAEAGKTAGMFTQALGRTIGRDMRSGTEKQAERLSNAVTTASGDTLYDKMITAAKNPKLSIQERYILQAQAQKIKPEKQTISAENFLDPKDESYFRGVELDTGDVLNLETRQIVPNALTAGDVKKQKPAEAKPPKPVEIQAFDDDTLDAQVQTSEPIKNSIEKLAQTPTIWGQLKDAFGFEVGDSVDFTDATYENMKIIVFRKAKEIQKQAAKDPTNPRSLSSQEALRMAVTAIQGGNLSGVAPAQAQGRDRFAGKVRAE